MLQIAVCDDEESAVQAHREMAERCLQQCGAAGKITVYTSSSSLLCDITEDQFYYDLILLDIEMPERTGMELAEKIKPFLPNVKIILSHRILSMPSMRLNCPYSAMFRK